MVDHVPNLLLNEAYDRDCSHAWRSDPSFFPLNLPPQVSGVMGLFFSGADTRHDREARVLEAIPFVYSPDFVDVWGRFDRRRTFVIPEAGSVFEFYKSKRSDSDWVSWLSGSELSARMFATLQPDDDGILDDMARLGGVYSESTETARRASAVLLGYLVRADWAYRRRVSKLMK